MGIKTYAQLKADVQKNLGNRGDKVDSIASAINTAQDRIARIFGFDNLREKSSFSIDNTGDNSADAVIAYTTITSTHRIRAILTIRALDEARSRKLVRRTPEQFDAIVPDISYPSRNIPQTYIDYSASIEIYPLPDQIYTIAVRYSRYPIALVEDADTSEFDGMDDLIVFFATFYVYKELGELDRAASYEKDAKKFIAEAVDEDTEDKDMDIIPAFEKVGDVVGEYWRNPWIK